MRRRVRTMQRATEFERQRSALDAHKTVCLTLIFTLSLLILPVVPALGQSATATVGAGGNPRAVAMNPLTNKIYVVNLGNGTTNLGNVTVIDGANNSSATVTDPNASEPVAVAVNPLTNKIYVVRAVNNRPLPNEEVFRESNHFVLVAFCRMQVRWPELHDYRLGNAGRQH